MMLSSQWRALVGGCLGMTAACAVHADPRARRYVNSEYGFSVQVPPDRPTCRAEPGTHDTGIIIFLDHGRSDCINQNQRSFIAVNGTYNATFAPNSLEALSILCGGSKPQPTDPDMFGSLKMQWPAMCRIEKDGFVEYILVHQNRTPTANTTPSVNYTIIVHMPTSSVSTDLKDAKPILKSVHLAKSSG